MGWKKNIFSYFLWLCYTVLFGTALYGAVYYMGFQNGANLYVIAGIFAGILTVAGIVTYVCRLVYKKLREQVLLDEKLKTCIQSFVVVASLAVGAYLRILYLQTNIVTGEYFEMAMMSGGYTAARIVHGITYFYVQLLHGICVFFGNQPVACVAVQIGIQLSGALFLFLGVKKLSGFLPALFAICFVSVSPFFVAEALTLSPRTLCLFFAGLALWLTANAISRTSGVLIRLIPGAILCGVVLYLDVIGVLAAFCIISVLTLRKEESEEWYRKPWFLAITGLGVMAVAFFGMVFADAILAGKRVFNVLNAIVLLYMPKNLLMPGDLFHMFVHSGGLILLVIASIGIFSFFCDKEKEVISLWVFDGLLIAAGIGCGIFCKETSGFDYALIHLAILAGAGISGLVLDKEEIETVKKAVMPVEKAEEKVNGVKLLDNPLPVPKKHVKKELDFDIEVADDDDFDI